MKKENAGKVVVHLSPLWGKCRASDKRGAKQGNTLWPLLPRLTAVLPPQGREMCGGFTLIELLVVVLIIGILAAVALPQYNKAVKKAQGREVLVALNTLDKAFAAYALEHGSINDMINTGGKDAPIEKLGITLPTLKHFQYLRMSGSFRSSQDFFALGSNTDLCFVGKNAMVKVRWNPTTGIRTSAVCEGDDCTAYFNCKSTSERQQCSFSDHAPLDVCPNNIITVKFCELE